MGADGCTKNVNVMFNGHIKHINVMVKNLTSILFSSPPPSCLSNRV